MKKIDVPLNSLEPLIQKISDLTKLQRILVCVGAVVVVIGLFVWLLYLPEITEQSKLSKDIDQQTVKLKETKANADQYDKYKKLMEDKQAEFNIVAKQLPKTDEVPTLLKNISQAGIDAGLSILLFVPEKEKPKNFYAEIPVRMQLAGTYNDLGVFFDRVAGMSRIVNIENFRVGRAKGGGGKFWRQAVKSMKGTTSSGKGPVVESPPLVISCTAVTYKFIESPPAAQKGKPGKKRRR